VFGGEKEVGVKPKDLGEKNKGWGGGDKLKKKIARDSLGKKPLKKWEKQKVQ